jgi:hypothetical protein
MRLPILAHITTLSATALAALAGGQPFDLSRFTIDGGGTMRSTGGNFELSGTIGQPDAGVLTGGTFQLTGGFWFEAPPGDCNNDGAANLLDVSPFEDCATGPGGPPAAGPCRCFDLDDSGRVDLRDFAAFQRRFVQQ